MKLEIELDLNKIDYDAINQQIREKIANMDLANHYQLDSKINRMVHDEVNAKVTTYLQSGGWYGNLNNESKKEINQSYLQ